MDWEKIIEITRDDDKFKIYIKDRLFLVQRNDFDVLKLDDFPKDLGETYIRLLIENYKI